MKAMARWLMVGLGLLALLSVARVAMADSGSRQEPAPSNQGISSDVHQVLATEEGVNRGEAIREVARGHGHERSADDGPDDGATPVDPAGGDPAGDPGGAPYGY